MGSLGFPELSLDSPFSSKVYLPKTIAKFIAELSSIFDEAEKMLLIDDYIKRLQDEMNKIEAFKRELPLCMDLLNDAILAMKNVLMRCRKLDVQPVLEEFLPLKKSNDDERFENDKENGIFESKDKMNWMNSVQLWNSGSQNLHFPNSDLSYSEQILKVDDCKKMLEEDAHPQGMTNLFQGKKKRVVGRSFVPCKESNDHPLQMMTKQEGDDKSPEMIGLSLCLREIKNPGDEISSLGLSPKSSCSRSGSSSATNGRSNFMAGHGQKTTRKQRRSWSPELHRRFLNALHQLGGAQVATPKQIRDHMQVDGLTNDEVKSHLQKYRLHARKIPPTTNPSSNIQSSLVLGGFLTSQEDCGGESLKQRKSQSNSPNGPLMLTGSSRGTSVTRGDSMEDDEKSESPSPKNQPRLSGTWRDIGV